MVELALKKEDIDTLRKYYEQEKKSIDIDMQSYGLQLLKESEIPIQFLQESSNDDFYDIPEEQSNSNLSSNVETTSMSIEEIISTPIVRTLYRSQNLESLTNQHYVNLYDFISPLERRTTNNQENFSYYPNILFSRRYHYSPKKRYN